jgi:hypothetical protein
MTDSERDLAVLAALSWTPFDHAGECYEWTDFPQKDGTTVTILRKQGGEKTFGLVLGPNAKASTEEARGGVDDYKEYL